MKIFYTLITGFNMDIKDSPLQSFLTIGYIDNNFIFNKIEFEVNPNKNYTKRYISKFLKSEINELNNFRLKIIEKPDTNWSLFYYAMFN